MKRLLLAKQDASPTVFVTRTRTCPTAEHERELAKRFASRRETHLLTPTDGLEIMVEVECALTECLNSAGVIIVDVVPGMVIAWKVVLVVFVCRSNSTIAYLFVQELPIFLFWRRGSTNRRTRSTNQLWFCPCAGPGRSTRKTMSAAVGTLWKVASAEHWQPQLSCCSGKKNWKKKQFSNKWKMQKEMGLVCITSWYPNFNGSHFGLPPSEIHRMTGLPPKIVLTMTYSHRPFDKLGEMLDKDIFTNFCSRLIKFSALLSCFLLFYSVPSFPEQNIRKEGEGSFQVIYFRKILSFWRTIRQ